MNENVPPGPEQNLDAPAKLVAALKETARRDVFVPPTVDRAILEAARRQLRPAAKSRPDRWRRWMLWPAFVTACLAAALIARLATTQQPKFSREDLNRDGRVDILDSFAVARELKSGHAVSKTFDVNGDGVVDDRDVNQIAAHAVALGKGKPVLKYWLTILFCALTASLFAQQPAGDNSVHFRAIDIYVDSGNVPLAAYQLEFSVTNVPATIVGIEGGSPKAFREPPFYDPKAMQGERVIIAAFSTETPEHLPSGKTRVATIHILTTGGTRPAFALKLQAAADPGGKRISATAMCGEKP